ncbi:MAG TPA: sucrase ferredoxin, partial [Gaiellaceae bacterium]|nr:sucrase ferredoxin [Gaiellaceae bacterium]
VGDRVDAQLVLVCGHGSRDACCALRGTAVFGALEGILGDEELWISSHQGGHRFAANVLVLPTGLQFGRVEVNEAPLLVARALAGYIELDRYRGRTCYEPAIQAAEHAVRSAAGIDRIDALRLAGVEGPVVRFRARGGTLHAAAVEGIDGPPVPDSCGVEPEPQPGFAVRVL